MIYAITDNGAANLAYGIVRQAVKDYKDALAGKTIQGRKPAYTQAECVRFFRSPWFGDLMPEAHGEVVIRECKRVVREEMDAGNLPAKNIT